MLQSLIFEQLLETPGQDDVVLTRKYGNEKWVVIFLLPRNVSDICLRIRIEFSIADLMNTPEEFDEYGEGNEEAPKNEQGGDAADPYVPTLPIRASIVVTKVSRHCF